MWRVFGRFRGASAERGRAGRDPPDRRADAVSLWEEMAELDQIEDTFPHLELAKHYEWHTINLEKASLWAAHAYQIVISRPILDYQLKEEIEHRLTRLAGKIEAKGER